MPFQSDKQKRWMYANEPEIAREWSDRYGAANGGIMDWVGQGGMKNYLGEQEMVSAPKHWQSAPGHETTELAYITPRERDVLVDMDMYGTMQGGPNEGPSGLMSLNGWGSKDESGKEVGMSGTATSAAETGSTNAADRREIAAHRSGPALPPGVVDKDTQDYRAAFINAGGGQRVNPGFFDSRTRLSPYERALAKAYRQDPRNRFAKKAYRKSGQGGIMDFLTGGGFLGNLLRGVGQKFGLGKKWNEPTYDMSDFNKLTLGGVDPFANLDIRDIWDRRKTEEDINIEDTHDFEGVDFNPAHDFEGVDFNNQGIGSIDTIANEYTPGNWTGPEVYDQQTDLYENAMADVSKGQLNTLKNLGIFTPNKKSAYSIDEVKEMVPGNESITDSEWNEILQGTYKIT